jgi:hypothetical protein
MSKNNTGLCDPCGMKHPSGYACSHARAKQLEAQLADSRSILNCPEDMLLPSWCEQVNGVQRQTAEERDAANERIEWWGKRENWWERQLAAANERADAFRSNAEGYKRQFEDKSAANDVLKAEIERLKADAEAMREELERHVILKGEPQNGHPHIDVMCDICGAVGFHDSFHHKPDCILAKPNPGDGLRTTTNQEYARRMMGMADTTLAQHCKHQSTHMRFDPHETPSVGPTIEVCNNCGMSRSHWEQGDSGWMTADVSDCKRADAPSGDGLRGECERLREAIKRLEYKLGMGNRAEKRMRECLEAFDIIDELRRPECTGIEIVSDNPDFNGQPDCLVIHYVNGVGTHYQGDSVLDCLRKASAALAQPAGEKGGE